MNRELYEVIQKKKLVLLDFDGTLLDSMGMWSHVGTDYIRSQGIEPPPDMEEKLVSKTLPQSGEYYIRELGLKKTLDEYMDDIYHFVAERYAHVLELKPGAYQFAAQLADAGKKRCVVTTTLRYCVESAMKNHGLDRLIPDVITCGDLNLTKTTPDIYLYAAGRFHENPEDTIVFEDASFAIMNAKKAGCTTVAVYDPSSAHDVEMIQTYADYKIRDFRELLTADGK